MSMEYCEYCDIMVDTDYNAEHFDTENPEFRCVAEEMDIMIGEEE